MAPVNGISDLEVSSLELDPRSVTLDLPSYLSSLSIAERQALDTSPDFLQHRKRDVSTLSTSEAPSQILSSRAVAHQTTHINPASGGIAPGDVNMKGIQALFAIIGVAFVLTGIWFFFWAKNGGFQWRKNDWEEYKSTVLRRRGPNGTTLSNATKSTKLGGGSVVGQGYSDDGASWTGTELSSEAPVMKEKKAARNAYNKKAAPTAGGAKEAKIRQVQQERWEGGHDDDMRAYRHEKPAKVGGLNRESEAKFYGTDYTETNASETRSNPRRDFSYGQDSNFSAQQHEPQPPRPPRHASPSKARASGGYTRQSVPGSYTEPLDFSDTQSQNTKSYHHPIPGLGKNGNGGGFRRGRDDDF